MMQGERRLKVVAPLVSTMCCSTPIFALIRQRESAGAGPTIVKMAETFTVPLCRLRSECAGRQARCYIFNLIRSEEVVARGRPKQSETKAKKNGNGANVGFEAE